MWHFNSFIIGCCICLFCIRASGERCHGRTEPRRLADFQEKLLYSPGYPNNYEINDDCTWIIAAAVGSNEYVIQLATIEINLNDYNSDCSTDYLEAYEGEGTNGSLLAKWCRNNRKIIKAKRSVTLKFHSDENITGRRFIISYSLIKSTKAECEEGQTGKIQVGAVPVYEYFQGKLSIPRCEWHVQSDDPSKKLLLELFEPSDVSCKNGSFDFYDGGDTSSHVSFEYCSTKKPFSLMFVRSNKVVIVFRSKVNSESVGMVLKISARSTIYECTVSNMPTIEVKDRPVIFAFPLAYNARNTSCPIRIWTPNIKKHLRLDVMGTDEMEADCDAHVIEVREMNSRSNNNVERSCNRGKNPVYRQITSDGLIVTSASNVYMRAAAVDMQCDGHVIGRTAYDSLIQEELIPFHGSYSNLDNCKYLIRAEKDNEIVHLSLKWRSVDSEEKSYTKQTICQGDYINIYDGDSETSPVLFSSCWPRDHTSSLVNATVQSSQKYILLVLDADAKTEGESASVRFHSIPGDNHCSNRTAISVTREAQTLTSSNYPNKLPITTRYIKKIDLRTECTDAGSTFKPFAMNQHCIYNLVSENPEEDIVVKVVDAGLHAKCKSFLAVYEGEYNEDDDDERKAVGRVCGKDNPTFRIPNSKATLVAVSEDHPSDGGWRVEVQSEEKGGHSTGTSFMLSITVIIKVLVAHHLA